MMPIFNAIQTNLALSKTNVPHKLSQIQLERQLFTPRQLQHQLSIAKERGKNQNTSLSPDSYAQKNHYIKMTVTCELSPLQAIA
jgi:hypothetical protein